MQISNFHLAIGIPLTFPFIPSSFFKSFVLMERPSFTYIQADNGPIHELRNNIVEKAIICGATHLIMMDVDQVYDPQTITKLLSHNLPIVGGLVHRRYPPFDSLMMKYFETKEAAGFDSIDDWEDNSLVEVDATGTGCLMFQMEVFRKLPYPWFKNDKNPDGTPIGEDFGFCRDARLAGYKIFVDTSLEIGHLATLIVNTATNRLYRACKSAQAANQALKIDIPAGSESKFVEEDDLDDSDDQK